MQNGFIKVAAAIPSVKVADCSYNVQQIESLIAMAEGKGVEVIVFPELCITGYTCQDLFKQTLLLEQAETSVLMLLDFTRKLDIISIVGVPVVVGDLLLNCAAVIQKGDLLGLVPKTYLPNYSEFYEKRWFASSQDLQPSEIRFAGNKIVVTPQPTLFRTCDGGVTTILLPAKRISEGLRGGAGWSPALWNGALFAMRIGARGQSMVNLKTDNTGQNPSAETERLSVEDILNGGANDYNPAAHLSVGTSSAPLDDTRTRFNRSHMASLNNLRKLSEDYQLSSSLTWGYDRLASDRAARQSWYLADGTRVDTEQESAASCRQQLSARIALKANTERFYMQEKLEASLAWNDLRAVLSGSYPNRQRAEAPAYGIENDLKYIRRTGTRSLTVTSYLKYLTRPQSLDVVRETGSQRQTIADRAFYMNHNAAFGTQAGRFAFAFKGGVSALFRGLVTDLTGTGLGTGTANDLSAGYAGIYLQPGITYRSQRLRLTLDLPAGYRRYGLHDRIDGSRTPAGIFTWKPRVAVKWSPTGRLSLSASGTVGRDAADDSRIGNGAVLRNYRSVLCGVNEYRQALQRSLSAGIAYKNPIGGFFASLLAVRSWNDLPFLPAQRFDGDYIVNYYVHSSNRVRSWYLSGDVSQNIDALNGQAGLNVGYNLSGTELLLEEVPASYENSTLTVAPRFNFRFAAWVNTEYRLEYRYTTLSIRGREPDGRHDFNQRLTVNLVPSKKWVIQFSAEHYYSQLSADRSKHLLLADASLRWKINGKWEATATAANLFGREKYAYTTFDGVSSGSYRYAIRPRNILLGASWKF